MLCFIDKKSLASVFAAHKCYDPVLKCFHDIISLIGMHKVCQDWYVTITDTPIHTHLHGWLGSFDPKVIHGDAYRIIGSDHSFILIETGLLYMYV